MIVTYTPSGTGYVLEVTPEELGLLQATLERVAWGHPNETTAGVLANQLQQALNAAQARAREEEE